jgi:thiol-disulfide isomerase/thioredoxin
VKRPDRIRVSQQLAGFVSLAFLAPLAFGLGQSTRETAPDPLALLERAARQYSDLKSYKITRQETFASKHPPDPSPTETTAIEAPGGRFRFEGESNWGKAIQVSDGHWVWYYRPTQNAYTRRPAAGKKPDLPEALAVDDIDIDAAAGLLDMTWLVGVFHSAKELPEEHLILPGQSFDCHVIQVTNDDRKIPLPYPFTDRIWIEKGSLKIRKIAEDYITTFHTPHSAPVTYPATRISVYPQVVLNEPVPDAEFKFTPPPAAQLVVEFQDRPESIPETQTNGRTLPDVVFKALDGSQVRLQSLLGHPVLIDLWATWCGPCVEAFPELARLYEQTRSTGLVILSIDQSDDAAVAQEYLKKLRYPWQNFHDPGDLNKSLGMGAVPRTIIIDSGGVVVFDKVSPTPQDLRAAIVKFGPEYARALGN